MFLIICSCKKWAILLLFGKVYFYFEIQFPKLPGKQLLRIHAPIRYEPSLLRQLLHKFQGLYGLHYSVISHTSLNNKTLLYNSLNE